MLMRRSAGASPRQRTSCATALVAGLSFVLLVMPVKRASREHGKKPSRSDRICLSEKCLQLPAEQTFKGHDKSDANDPKLTFGLECA